MDYQQLSLISVVASAVLFAAVLVVGFNKYLTPAVASAQRMRNEEIAQAERRRDEAVAEAARLREQQTKLVKSLEESRARSEVEARRERERLIAEARSEGERIVRHADGELERARTAGQAALQTELIDLALRKARARAEQEVDAATDRRLTESFFDQVAARKGSYAEVSRG